MDQAANLGILLPIDLFLAQKSFSNGWIWLDLWTARSADREGKGKEGMDGIVVEWGKGDGWMTDYCAHLNDRVDGGFVKK